MVRVQGEHDTTDLSESEGSEKSSVEIRSGTMDGLRGVEEVAELSKLWRDVICIPVSSDGRGLERLQDSIESPSSGLQEERGKGRK